MKRMFKISGIILLIILLIPAMLLACLSVTEYRPELQETAETKTQGKDRLTLKEPVRILSWNTGYGGLDKSTDFFMDGGKMVNPKDKETVKKNLSAISEFIKAGDYDISLLQEVDRNSSRTDNMDELASYTEQTNLGYSYAPNYRCSFVPYPFPPIGKVESGIATLSNLALSDKATRLSLPCPFKWPIRTANLKRCLLISRYPIKGTDKKLVAVNLHLEAYDNGEGKKAQTAALMNILQEEYEKGNYVVAGGDFNQTFPNSLDIFPINNPKLWTPGIVDEDALSEGWKLAYDTSVPSCRLLNQPYDPDSHDTQHYVIDGFIISPNIKIDTVETVDLGFANSDHNPVCLQIMLE
ncbi:MAG: endonuclease/exonuclease/phosphatase family protein [Dorea sp.]|jgi:endonuclease/exonuclease/phosphatase family metal-dependent hydrolase|nr:endonuclease/exonuclease/phosphatase family protein [Dorea sp.]